MARNVEIKARVSEFATARRGLLGVTTREDPPHTQIDTFFDVRRGRLKLREFADGTGELIFYERPDQCTAKLSEYDRMPCQDSTVTLRALGTALGIRGIVNKRREVLFVGATRVHLDEVEGLGTFVEIEVVLGDAETVASGERTAARLLSLMGIPDSDLLRGAYIDLLEGHAGAGAAR